MSLIETSFKVPHGWSVEVDEQSAGVYQVTATGSAGKRVEVTGTEDQFEAMQQALLRWILEVTAPQRVQ